MSKDSTYGYAGTEDFVIENGILKGSEAPYITGHDSFGDLILDRLKANRKLVGQINGLTGTEETFGEMMEKSVKCAMWLKKQNIQPGDVVAVATDIRMDAYVPAFASLYVGAIFNARSDVGLTREEARHFLELTRPKVLFTTEISAAIALKVAREIGLDMKTVILGKLTGLPSLEYILATQDNKLVSEFRCTKLSSLDAPAVLIYTSGTTASPKSATHSHRSLFGNTYLASKLGDTRNNSVTTSMVFSPLSWVTGLICMLKGVIALERRVIYPEFKAETTLQLIEKFQVNWMLMGTGSALKFLKCSALRKYNVDSLQFIYMSGAVLGEATQKALAVSFPRTKILQIFGATELGGVGLQQTSNDPPGSCGRPAKNLKLKVVDPETKTVLGPNQIGEACFISPFMMSGYYKNQKATSEAIDAEGWYHTGDLVHYDEEGHVFVTDRIQEIIKYREHRISPAMLEQLLQAHPGVLEVAVIAAPHPADCAHPIAFVTKMLNAHLTKDDLEKLVSDELPDYMKLRGGVQFWDELPRTPSGKISKGDLRNMLQSRKIN